ncbi:MAG: ornithine cyclodeaminase family protein [Gemmatimonadota bacterium]|nr:ornithine cyclodeaminase family protein [Gemmatimonadota bacterium]MDH4350547.1 ornithine cyclodeaminase family protein [Gemmatimonadota bacterium]MDH5197116.1 ornithine cyclodeaminase family protein [Gemmatimonadota bacterium]
MRLLTRSDVQRLLPMADAIVLVRDAFRALSAGQASAPLRSALRPPGHDGVTLVMPGHVGPTDALAVKVVSVRNENPVRGLPRINALVVLVDAATGIPAAVMDGRYLTALRTGASSGVATEVLARADATVLAMIGAGAQAQEQILAVAAVRPIRRVLVYARHADVVQTFITQMVKRCGPGIAFEAAKSAEDAVRQADVVCTATTSRTPVFDGTAVRPGVHLNGVGSYRPDMRELDVTTLQRADRIVVDQREAALEEAGELIQAIAEGAIPASAIDTELGEVIAGTKPGRERPDDVTLFKSVGNAVQDAAVAHAVVVRAERDGVGTVWDHDR